MPKRTPGVDSGGDQDRSEVTIRNFEGINTVDAKERLGDAELRDALNVDIDRAGRIRRRAGFVSRYAGALIRSLWADQDTVLFAEGTELKRLNRDFSATVVATGLSGSRKVAYVKVNNDIYFSDGVVTGRLNQQFQQRAWGVESPGGQPTLSAGSGTLSAGRYQVAVTFVTASGEESGASLAAVIELPDNSGISFASIPVPVDPDVAFVRLYCSRADGDALYKQADLPVGLGGFVLGSVYDSGMQLKTQFLSPMCAGQKLAYFNGRLLVAAGSVLWYTEPLRYGLTDARYNFVQFADDITVLYAGDSGVHVATETATHYLRGANPVEWTALHILPYGAPSTAAVELPGSYVSIEANTVGVWQSNNGIVAALDGGAVVNLTEKKVAMPNYAMAASLYREQDGIRQFMAVAKQASEANRLRASDEFTIEVRHNGVVT